MVNLAFFILVPTVLALGTKEPQRCQPPLVLSCSKGPGDGEGLKDEATCECIEPALARGILVRVNPLYRYWNGQDHFYTTNFRELGMGSKGYSIEGVVGKVLIESFPGAEPLYRYWNGKDHFYTINSKEIGTTTVGNSGKGGYVCEGYEGFCFRKQITGTVPLHRYVSFNNGDHFYTVEPNEIGTIQLGHFGKNNHMYEGVACYIFQ